MIAKSKMELTALLSPFGTIQFLPIASRSIFPKIFFANNDIARQQCVQPLFKQDWFRQLDPLFLPASAPARKTHPQFFWRVYTATLEGDVSVEESSTVLRLENELHEPVQLSQEESGEKLFLDAKASQRGQKPWVSKKYAPRRCKQIAVGLDALKPGVVLTGKVTNIQKYGAFVDVGAFTSGLIHISNLSKTFVGTVEDVVKVGQEVRVEIIFVNVNAKRLSLKLKNEEPEPMVEQLIPLSEPSEIVGRGPRSKERVRQELSSDSTSKPQKGEILTGLVNKIVPSGVFVTLRDKHQGFLPASEVLSSGGSVETASYFRLGQEIPVRVLRTTKDRIKLTMKKQVNAKENREIFLKDQGDRAVSPFEIAFRKNKIIASYLEERERFQNISKGKIDESTVVQSAPEDSTVERKH